jgi:hypothetical protein
MDKDDFDLAGKAWFNQMDGKYDGEKYLASISRGIKGTIFLMGLDASFLTSNEKIYWDLPLISVGDITAIDDVDPEIKDQLGKLAELILYPDQKSDSIQTLLMQMPYFKSAGLSYQEYIDLLLKRE